jgi:hypothetical protein
MQSAPTLEAINVKRAQHKGSDPEIAKSAIGRDSDIFFPKINLVN